MEARLGRDHGCGAAERSSHRTLQHHSLINRTLIGSRGAGRTPRLSTKRSSQALRPVASRRKDSPIIEPVIPVGPSQEDAVDLFTYLLRNRIIFVRSFITFEVATQIVGGLLALEAENNSEDIKIYINSPGGVIYAVLGILDVMEHIKPDIQTVAFGTSRSSATLLLAGGTKGKRFSMPNTRIGLQQPAGFAMGSSEDTNVTAMELNRSLKVVNGFFAQFTGRTIEEMEMETNREHALSPQEAIDLGLIDAIA